MQCVNHLKQLGLAMHNYESSNACFAPQMVLTFNASGGVAWKSSWGASSRVLPFLEGSNLYNTINYIKKVSDASNATAVSTPVKTFLCPSEVNTTVYSTTSATTGLTTTYGLSNYAWAAGTWYTFGGATNSTPGQGAISTNLGRPLAAITDGTSNTLLAAEVKTYTAVNHDCGAVPGGGPTGPTANPDVPTVLSSIAASASSCKAIAGINGLPGGGHTHWCNGNTFYDAFTTALPPNTRSPAGILGLDTDLTSEDEDDGGPTYSAVTSRSYHPGGVNALFADGSVHFLRNTINWQTWRALGTVSGGEVLSADQY